MRRSFSWLKQQRDRPLSIAYPAMAVGGESLRLEGVLDPRLAISALRKEIFVFLL
jgi:hypothetical protein